jgi:hypothetical protein
LTPETALRFTRQIQLSEVGPEGQARIVAARVIVAGGDTAAGVAATYLRAAGVGTVIELGDLPADGAGWLFALAGVDVVVRSGFDDDAMLAAATRLGLPVVVTRARPDVVDVLSKPGRAPVADAPLDVPVRAAAFVADHGPAAVVAGTLAAAETLQVLLRARAPEGFARHLRLPFEGGDPVAQRLGAR